MAQRAYLDWNATAPLRPQARAAVVAALEMVGNPSSVHAEGRRARHLIEDAREKVARLTGAEAAGVTFTSGATEANALALHPALEIAGARVPRDRLLVSAIEHVSVLKGGRFPADAIEVIPVTESGFVDCEALRRLLRQSARPLVSVMLANNETGVVQPIRDIAAIVHETDGLLHVDAVQGPGRIGVNLSALGADMMSLSAHKIGGPKGVGALVRRHGLHIAVPMIAAGGQERGLRGGTENVPGIAGFGAAAEAVQQSFAEEVALLGALRERLEAGLRAAAPEVVIFGSAAERLPNMVCFSAPGMKAETAVIAFDLDGIAVSAGAACSSGRVQSSHVLAAMGVPPALAQGAVRVSLGATSTPAEIDQFLAAWKKLSKSLVKERTGLAA
ncbi:MAG: cysteine desulfurase [Pseudorhodoplanes sp.]|nr:cysteine desulfurase [Pseudorhodoplanes sp.]